MNLRISYPLQQSPNKLCRSSSSLSVSGIKQKKIKRSCSFKGFWQNIICTCLVCAQASLANAQTPSNENDLTQKTDIRSPLNVRSSFSPPQLIKSVKATYPPDALAAGLEAKVELMVTVLKDGSVGKVSVKESSDVRFNQATMSAIRTWHFKPAYQGLTPVACQIKVPFIFSLPKDKKNSTTTSTTATATATATTNNAVTDSEVDRSKPDHHTLNNSQQDSSVEVIAKRKRIQRGSSDFYINRQIIAAAPRQEGAEVLRSAPGLYIGRSQGPAVAHSYMLRGFDAEHGQDIAFSVGGIPINLPSHIHGQGYSDLGFLIGDVVHGLHVSEGVYNPDQGDFAVAGSIDLSLGVDKQERGLHLYMTRGSWNTKKYRGVWAPKQGKVESFGAVQFMETEGFGENRKGLGGSGIFQHSFTTDKVKFRVLGILHTARSEFAGVLTKDDVEAGKVCFLCVYPYPTAQAQNALSNRMLLGFFADYKDRNERGQIGFWLSYDTFRLQNNFSGFQERSRTLERVSGRGDLIEQRNHTKSIGFTSSYRTLVFNKPWIRVTATIGGSGRIDMIDQTQSLLDASVRSQTWDQRVDASINAVDLGSWGELKWVLKRRLKIRTGLRINVLSYDINDRLGNFVPLTRPQDAFITGFRRSALGSTWGPRSSLEFRAQHWLTLLAAYGEGYRSPQARLLEDSEEAPFSKVTSMDLGIRLAWDDVLHVTLGGYHTELSDDVAFDTEEGRLERIGATQRLGAFIHTVARPLPWLVSSFSATFVDATLLDPPPATAEDPVPPFIEGQRLPFVPPLVVRVDLGAQSILFTKLGPYSLRGKFGLGLSHLSPRPLPYGEYAEPITLLDLSAGLRWGSLELSFEFFNALNSEYSAVEFSFPSDWSPDDGLRSRTPIRHTAAGAPLSWALSLGVHL